MIYLFQRIIHNGFQWTRPSPGRLGRAGEGAFVGENGFGHEDWNFNKSLLIDDFLYGYCYYHPAKNRQADKFNIAFATYRNRQWNLIGFYINCAFIVDPPIREDVIQQKMGDLRQLGSSLGRPWAKLGMDEFKEKLRAESQWLKWRVSPENAIRTAQPVLIPKRILNPTNYRIVNPTDLEEKDFNSLLTLAQEENQIIDYGEDLEFPEGRALETLHKSRERNQALVRAAKEAFRTREGKLYCQVCGFDFQATYGDIGHDFIEAHHTLPMSELLGETKNRVQDIALVCPNCHRMLHRRRPWLQMNELQKLLTKKA